MSLLSFLVRFSYITAISLSLKIKIFLGENRSHLYADKVAIGFSEIKISHHGNKLNGIFCNYSSYYGGHEMANAFDDHLMSFYSSYPSRDIDPEPFILLNTFDSVFDSIVLYNRIHDCCKNHIRFFKMAVYYSTLSGEEENALFIHDFNVSNTVTAVYNFTLHWNSSDIRKEAEIFDYYSFSQHNFLSLSQAGQDIFVVYALNGLQNGRYIEIGANDGVTFSNSYMLEKEFSWNGLLIEPQK